MSLLLGSVVSLVGCDEKLAHRADLPNMPHDASSHDYEDALDIADMEAVEGGAEAGQTAGDTSSDLAGSMDGGETVEGGSPGGAWIDSTGGSTGGSELPEPPPWAPPISEEPGRFKMRVLLDNVPISGVHVTQGGATGSWETDERGEVWVELDVDAIPPMMIFGAHPEARTRGIEVSADQVTGVTLSLTRFSPLDQPDYPFADPGEPTRRDTTSQCGHCHLDINDQWFESPHRSSARNPIVYDLYTGRGSGWRDEESCTSAGGRWAVGPVEGGEPPRLQCYFEISALGAFNDECREPPCDPSALGEGSYFGGCADCHAPTVDGIQGGGHDLLSVNGRAFEYGVSCDLCHHVERVEEAEPAGVGGRLVLQRPRERASFTLGGGGYLPLSFGPNSDVSNPRMGISPREHFRDGQLCSGCHQHSHDDLHAGSLIDRVRWPEGLLPNQSTYAEWREGPLGEGEDASTRIPCNSCHMPPNPSAMNSASLEHFPAADIGRQGGWPREHGDTRAHAWWGPRQPQSPILQLSAGLSLSQPQLISTDRGDGWAVEAEVSNIGAGHGLPTGEPMRHLILLVEARCGDQVLEAIGGDAVHDIGGSLAERAWTERNRSWPQARVGDVLRVVRERETFYEYDGYGPFRDTSLDQSRGMIGTHVFDTQGKGLRREEVIAAAQVTSIDEDHSLTLSQPLLGQAGDRVYLTRDAMRAEITGASYAGQSGFSFARVLVDNAQRKMAPHFIARDLIRDNRLRPGARWRSRHIFRHIDECPSPEITARLIYRPYPLWLAQERGWLMWDREIRRVSVDNTQMLDLPPAAGPRRAVNTLEGSASLIAPAEWVSDEGLNQLPALLVSITAEDARAASRRGESWPWKVTLAHDTAMAGQPPPTADVPMSSGPTLIFNLSDHPLALEPLEGYQVVGASEDQTPPPSRVLRTQISQATALWVIPPHAGALLLPRVPQESTPLIAVGYTAHGGRSWVPSTLLASLNASPSHLNSTMTLSEGEIPRISRLARPQARPERQRPVIKWAYQGSPRSAQWHLSGVPESGPAISLSASSSTDEDQSGYAVILTIRNLAATAQPFEIEGAHHWRWSEGAWSRPRSVSWIPVHGEILVAVPHLSAGQYRVGVLSNPELQGVLEITP